MQVLKYEVARQPEALGSTVFGYNDAYTSLKPFLQRWRSSAAAQQGPSPPSQQRPYLLSVDITRAFDSIDTELMLAIVAPVLQCHEYLIFRYLEVWGPAQQHLCMMLRTVIEHSRPWLSRATGCMMYVAPKVWSKHHLSHVP